MARRRSTGQKNPLPDSFPLYEHTVKTSTAILLGFLSLGHAVSLCFLKPPGIGHRGSNHERWLFFHWVWLYLDSSYQSQAQNPSRSLTCHRPSRCRMRQSVILNKMADFALTIIVLVIACDRHNSLFSPSSTPPVFGVLCDGSAFEFFKFEDENKLFSFSHGCISGDPSPLQRGLPISSPSNPRLFIKELRVICETFFDVMLQAYISSVEAFHDPSLARGKKNKQWESLTDWEDALQLVHGALKKGHQANESCSNCSTPKANLLT
jgi:hypothetical protein